MNNPLAPHNQSHGIRYYIDLIEKNKLYFIISACIFLSGAFFLNKTTNNVYKVGISLVLNEDQNTSTQTTANIMRNMGFTASNKNFTNELIALRSSPLIADALAKLDFRISYFEKFPLTTKELYKSSPFIVILDQNLPQAINVPIEIEVLDNGQIEVSISSKNVTLYSFSTETVVEQFPKLNYSKMTSFNNSIKSEAVNLKVMLNDNFNSSELVGRKFIVIINNQKDLVKIYQSKLNIAPSDVESTVAVITMKTSVPSKSIDFLSSLMSSYISRDIEKKNFISERTIEYIDKQLDIVEDSLQKAEENLQQFRSGNQVVDIAFQSSHTFDELQKLENEKAELSINTKYYNYIDEYFKKNQEYSDLISPAGMGIQDPLLNNLIQELISLNAEKVSFIENNQEKSPYLKKINIRIDNLKKMIVENISYIKKTTEIKIADLNSRIRQLNNEIQKLPQTERKLLGMERKFNLNDAIYTYLLEMRSSAQITKVSNQSDAEIIEPADYLSYNPLAPNKKRNYFVALMLGLIFPFVILRFKELTRIKLNSADDILRQVELPVIGQIYKSNKKIETVVTQHPRSHITESFRRLRTSLNYFMNNEDCNIAMLTSTISGEGKSFVSVNLALSIANANIKCLLIGTDLRKPKLYDNLNIKPGPGLSDFLSRQATLPEVIQKTSTEHLDLIWAGVKPPNPGELIVESRIEEMLNELRQEYQYIIIDTAPIGILADASCFLNLADLKIFVTRINHTSIHESVEVLNELKAQGIKNLALLINDVSLPKKSQSGYGYYEVD